jgi:hypothetical protein
MNASQMRYLLNRINNIKCIKEEPKEPKEITYMRDRIELYDKNIYHQGENIRNCFLKNQTPVKELIYKGDFDKALIAIKALEEAYSFPIKLKKDIIDFNKKGEKSHE